MPERVDLQRLEGLLSSARLRIDYFPKGGPSCILMLSLADAMGLLLSAQSALVELKELREQVDRLELIVEERNEMPEGGSET